MEKHGSFTIYAGTSEKLVRKVKMAKFAVLDVTHVMVGTPTSKLPRQTKNNN
jgi:hypothetical protein